MYMKIVHTWKKKRGEKRKKETEGTCAKAPPRDYVEPTYLHTSAEEASTRSYQYRRTLLDWYIQPRCSPRPLATAVYSSPRSFCSLLASFLINIILRFRGKKSSAYHLSSHIAWATLPGEEITESNLKVSVKVKEASREPSVPLRCHSRWWHRYFVLEEIPAARRIPSATPQSRSTFTFVRLLPVHAYCCGRFQDCIRENSL